MNLLNIPKSPGYSGPIKPIAPGYPVPNVAQKRKSPSGYSSKNLLQHMKLKSHRYWGPMKLKSH